MSEYTLADAIADPDRPLTKSPDEWVTEVKQRRGSANAEAVKTASNGDSVNESVDEEGVARVDSAADSIIGGIREFYDALASLKRSDLTSKEREVFNKVTDLLDTAISPYMSDIVKELDKLEEE